MNIDSPAGTGIVFPLSTDTLNYLKEPSYTKKKGGLIPLYNNIFYIAGLFFYRLIFKIFVFIKI